MLVSLRNRSILGLDRRTALLILTGIMSLFVIWHYSETIPEETYVYSTDFVKPYLSTCSISELPNHRAPLKLYSLCFSDQVFGNPKTIPFLFSVLLFPVTFLLASRICKNYTCGVMACSLLLGSKIIGLLGPTMAFSPDWALLFMGSIYAIYRKPVLVGPLFFGSMAMKGLGFLLTPVLLYWIISADISKKSKIISCVSVGLATIVIFGLWLSGNSLIIQQDGFKVNFDQAGYGLEQILYMFRHDQIQYLLIPVSLVNLFLMRKNPNAKSLLYMSLGWIALVFLLPVFSIYQMYDYRMIPLIIFSGIGCAMIPLNPHFKKIKKFNIQ